MSLIIVGVVLLIGYVIYYVSNCYHKYKIIENFGCHDPHTGTLKGKIYVLQCEKCGQISKETI